MNRANISLSESKRTLWAKAAKTFPGDMLDQVVSRTLNDLDKERTPQNFYEVRRIEVPNAFQNLLKLQNTGFARMYIEVKPDEFQEVLQVEVTLLDAIMVALALLLDVINGMMPPLLGDGGSLTKGNYRSPNKSKPIDCYAPSWKRQPPRISYEDPSP